MVRVVLALSREWQDRLSQTVLWRDGVERIDVGIGDDAVFDAARRLNPRLVLLEGITPQTIAQVRRLRQDPATRTSSVAVIVAAPTPADRDELRRAGANAVLSGADLPAQWDDPFETLLGIPPRRDARIPVQMKVTSRRDESDPGAVTGSSLNVSVKGLLLETAVPLVLGTIVTLALRLPSSTEELRLVGRVVWVSVGRGGASHSGIKFLGFHGNAMERIRQFVESADPAAGS